ncbi:hypothetical protein LMG23994_01000 [Cupriavidus pinatubonensis]|uniref:Uncharacterized protein n=1 Tax=Cupriavidus pinatubonensis TaxID=248026 RepID=A0ABM8WGM4_9BURK|nr:hypothetical protein LMG23994_01000 [Cupriavidus pinatubonensis]
MLEQVHGKEEVGWIAVWHGASIAATLAATRLRVASGRQKALSVIPDMRVHALSA